MSVAIEREILRNAILEALAREPRTQYVNLEIATARVAQERGLPVQGGAVYSHDPHLVSDDHRRFRELVWSLITQGLLSVGMDDNNVNWPFLSLTEWGEEYVKSGSPDVYDPDGYLRRLNQAAPLDPIETRFLGQAIAAFRVDLPDAAAVMLGAAAEHLVLEFVDQIGKADPALGAAIRKKGGDKVFALLRELSSYFVQNRKALPRQLGEEVETTFNGISAFIRTARNDGGHPTLGVVSRDRAFAALTLYPIYREWVIAVRPLLPL